MGLIGMSYPYLYLGAGDATSVDEIRDANLGQNDVPMSHVITRYADKPCNHLVKGVLKDKNNSIQNQWV